MRRLPPLSSLRAFEAAARHESFKLAAEELGVTSTAISHQIRSLEEILGHQLFERHTRKVSMTSAARQIFPALRDGFDLFAKTLQPLMQDDGNCSVIVTATTAFASHWLVPRLHRFRALHPHISLSVLASNDVVNLESGAADLAIRFADAPPPTNQSVFLFQDIFAPVAAPGFEILHIDALRTAPLISYDWHRSNSSRPGWETWIETVGLKNTDIAAPLHFNEESHALEAAIAGQGVAFLSLVLSSDALQRGLLKAPFDATVTGQSCYLLRDPRRKSSTATAAVESWLLDELRPFAGSQAG